MHGYPAQAGQNRSQSQFCGEGAVEDRGEQGVELGSGPGLPALQRVPGVRQVISPAWIAVTPSACIYRTKYLSGLENSLPRSI